MRRAVIACAVSIACIGLTTAGTADTAPAPLTQAHWAENGCARGYPSKVAYKRVSQLVRSYRKLTKKRARIARRYIDCVETAAKSRAVHKHFLQQLAWRRSYAGYWRIQAKRAKLARPVVFRFITKVLIGCEGGWYSREPGHPHYGAYQYADSTWAAAQSAFGAPLRYRKGRASWASKDHQDAVTTRFWPGPNNDWVASIHCWSGKI